MILRRIRYWRFFIFVPTNLFQYACPTGTGCACPTGTSATCANLLVPLGQVVLVPVACPSGTSLVQAPPFESRSMTNFRVIPYQKPKSPNQISEIPYQKSLSNWSKIETKNCYFFTFSVVNSTPDRRVGTTVASGASYQVRWEQTAGAGSGWKRASAAATSSITRITTPMRGASR